MITFLFSDVNTMWTLIGAAILGPRIGKYSKDGRVNAIPGHSITLGTVLTGIFISSESLADMKKTI